MTGRIPTVALLGPLPPAVGGIATHMAILLRSPLARKYRYIPVRTMSRKHGTPGYHRESVAAKISRVFKDLMVFVSVLVVKRPDLIHINTSFNDGAFLRDSLYVVTAKVCGKKILLQVHGGYFDEFWKTMGLLRKRWIRFILGMPRTIVVLSKVQREALVQAGFGQKTCILPNMIDVREVSAVDSESSGDKDRNGKIRVLFVASHFTKSKGVWDLFEAMKTLCAAPGPSLLFVWVGGGEEEKGMQEKFLEEGLTKAVQFTGFLDKRGIGRWMRNTDIFVLPSHSEGFPFTVLEAMSRGLPVVAARTGALPDMIEDGENGYLIPIRDPGALAVAIRRLASDGDLRRSMGRNNVRKVRERFDVDVVCEGFDRCYESLLHEDRQ
jgi:glycosyltransferase involved in cell wall biosynthesis